MPSSGLTNESTAIVSEALVSCVEQRDDPSPLNQSPTHTSDNARRLRSTTTTTTTKLFYCAPERPIIHHPLPASLRPPPPPSPPLASSVLPTGGTAAIAAQPITTTTAAALNPIEDEDKVNVLREQRSPSVQVAAAISAPDFEATPQLPVAPQGTWIREAYAERPYRTAAAAAAVAPTPSLLSRPCFAPSECADSIHRESVVAGREGGRPSRRVSPMPLTPQRASYYRGPGPDLLHHRAENIYRCFDEQNGLLFRLEDRTHHTWAFYNDTTQYVMRVTATFGRESMVHPLGATAVKAHDPESGLCTLTLCIDPGATEAFMKGEYNGFRIHYDAKPLRRRRSRGLGVH